jgi:hypothetical protein
VAEEQAAGGAPAADPGATPAAAPAAEPAAGAAGAPAAPVVPAKTDADYERRMEEVMAVDRQAKESQRQADIKLKQAEDLVKSVGHLKGAHERLTKGELNDLVEVAQDLYGDKLNEDLLMALAKRITEGKPPVDPETLFEQKWAQKEAEKAAQKAKDDDAARVAREQVEDAEWVDYRGKSAAFLVAHKDDPRFELCHSLGVDEARYAEALEAHIKEHKEIPDPEVLLLKIEAEHEAKLPPSRRAQRAADQQAGVVFSAPIVPRGHVSEPPPLDDDPWRARLMKQDQEERTKRALGRTG